MTNGTPHYTGHRARLRERLVKDGASLADYEILELLLGYALLRKDTKPLAKELLARFGSIRGVLDALPVQEALPDKNYGDAQLVSANETSNDKYFEQARLTRSKTRDEALDTMQQALKNAELSETEKTAVTQTLTNTINSITVESDIENMVKAKGFADCVAFIEGEKINLAVKTGSEGLDKSEVAQLRDIILGKMETEAKNISIVEVK